MKHLFYLSATFFVSILGMSACGNNLEQTVRSSDTAEDGAKIVSEPSDIPLAPFAIKDSLDNEVLKMIADGSCYFQNKTSGIISKKGELKSNNGRVTSKMQGDSLLDRRNNFLAIIDADGRLTNAEGQVSYWDENGYWVRGEERTNFKLEPADKDTKKAATILLYSFRSIKD